MDQMDGFSKYHFSQCLSDLDDVYRFRISKLSLPERIKYCNNVIHSCQQELEECVVESSVQSLMKMMSAAHREKTRLEEIGHHNK